MDAFEKPDAPPSAPCACCCGCCSSNGATAANSDGRCCLLASLAVSPAGANGGPTVCAATPLSRPSVWLKNDRLGFRGDAATSSAAGRAGAASCGDTGPASEPDDENDDGNAPGTACAVTADVAATAADDADVCR